MNYGFNRDIFNANLDSFDWYAVKYLCLKDALAFLVTKFRSNANIRYTLFVMKTKQQ